MLNLLDDLNVQATQECAGNNSALNRSIDSRSHRLPRIDVPKFTGVYSEWSNFRDLFVTMIRDNSDISPVEKFHYLKLSLSGEPAQLLKNLAVTEANFSRAWEILIARYDNKRVLIDAQLASLFSTRKITSENSSECKRLLGDVKEALGALEALGCPVKHWDLLVIFLTVSKLDIGSLKRWEKKLGAASTPPSFDDLESFLISRIYTLEALERSQPRKSISGNPALLRPLTGTRSHAAAAPEQACALCAAGHYVSFCPKYQSKTPDQRREIIYEKNLCFNCLGPHLVKACRNSKRCRLCQQQHHTSLHASSKPADISSCIAGDASEIGVGSRQSTLLKRPSSNDHGSGTSSASYVSQFPFVRRTPVLLATAVVTVFSRAGESWNIRALLDQGSEASFISESAAQSLRLPRRAVSVPIVGIGEKRNTISNGLACLTFASRVDPTKSFTIEALVLPRLTSYLPAARIDLAHWTHLKGLTLADPDYANSGKIDVILGANIFAQILEEDPSWGLRHADRSKNSSGMDSLWAYLQRVSRCSARSRRRSRLTMLSRFRTPQPPPAFLASRRSCTSSLVQPHS